MRHGGKVLIDHLAREGVAHVFLVPGESFLAALDGLHDCPSIQAVVCRHEGGAAMMAEATGKLTGRPGVAFVTRGPGVANAVSGVYVAAQDATPMVLFVGLPPLRLEHRAPFQEIDLVALFSGLAKWTAVVRDTGRLAEYAARAVHVAMAGRPGPVVIGLPEDVLSAAAEVADLPATAPSRAGPDPAHMAAIGALLSAAERPALLVGGPGWSVSVQRAVEAFAQSADLPIAAAFRCQDYIDNRHPSYVGHVGFATDKTLADGLKSADLILAIGAELGEISSGAYALIGATPARQKLIHVHPEPAWSGGVVRADLVVAASAEGFGERLADLSIGNGPARWQGFRRDLRAAYEASLAPRGVPGRIGFDQVVNTVSALLPEGGLVTNGAGNYSQFVHRYMSFRGYRSGLAPICGSMGYGLPAAIAAKLAEPERAVVAFAGDGCFQMTATELGTALEFGAPVVVIIANNGIYGTIRMHQERRYPGRVSGTGLLNPDFAALARSFGAAGETVAEARDFEPVFRRALASPVPFVIEVRLDPEAITPIETLSGVRAQARSSR